MHLDIVHRPKENMFSMLLLLLQVAAASASVIWLYISS